MADKAWKAEERKISKKFGSHRALLKGTNEKKDVTHDKLCIDVKLRKRWRVRHWFDELKDYTNQKNEEDGTDLIPILSLRLPNKHKRYAVLDLEDLIDILRQANLLEPESP